MSNLVIVESPTKANTIKGYLGSSYKVIASKGHVRDLPKSTLGVDIENGFKPHYISIQGKGELLAQLRKEAKAAGKVFLAADPDREGEAISWHLAASLGIPLDKPCRISFNEVSKAAVKDAVKHPRPIDMDLVNSQQARRILDRIVGYKISPFLWKSVKSGLSAGRVQSVATRIIVDRENEIRAFAPEEYWTVDADLTTKNGEEVEARYYGDGNGKKKLSSKEDADGVLSDVNGKDFSVVSVKKAKKNRNPQPPFTTSTLQQEASRKLGFQSQRIMKVAQELYEGINLGSEFDGTHGLITYMRTDSLRVSSSAQESALSFITAKYGENYCPAKPNVYKTKSMNAQDAHEAVRPSDVNIEPSRIKKFLTPDQYKLYKLIWERFVASQMAPAKLNTVTVDFRAGVSIFRANGYTVEFQGFLALYEESTDDSAKKQDADEVITRVPPLAEGDILACKALTPAQHFTEPPARFTEASLVKFLEEKGIGRPSTYTPIITTIIARGYVKREGRSLCPTPLGELTTGIMNQGFPEIVNYEFTANMEDKLDKIASGGTTMEAVLSDFYGDFEKELQHAAETVKKTDISVPPEETDIICEKCGARMVIKNGRYGKFAACPNYPTCKNTKQLGADGKTAEKNDKPAVVADFKCELCGGDMVLRTGRYGSFYACVNYPTCKFTKKKVRDTGVLCPDCGGRIVTKKSRSKMVFYSCENYPKCKFSSWDLPTNEKCPNCGKILFAKKSKKLLVCGDKECGYSREYTPAEKPEHDENDGE